MRVIKYTMVVFGNVISAISSLKESHPLNNIVIELMNRMNVSSCYTAVVLKITNQAADSTSLFVTDGGLIRVYP